jgi:hypothetical protein
MGNKDLVRDGYLENILNVAGIPSTHRVVFKYSDGEISYFNLDEEIDLEYKKKVLTDGHAPIYWFSYMFPGEVPLDKISSKQSIVSLALDVWKKKGHNPLSIDDDETVSVFLEKVIY